MLRAAACASLVLALAACGNTTSPPASSPTPHSYTQAVAQDHPTGWWRTLSGPSAPDASGQGNDGQAGDGVSLTPGPFASSQAFSFSGSASILVNHPLGLAQGTGFEFWARYTAGTTHIARSNFAAAPGPFHFVDLYFDPKGAFTVEDFLAPGTNALFASPYPVTPGSWHYFAYTSDGTTASLWQDGAKVASSPTSGLAAASQPPASLGFQGSGLALAEPAFYASGLSPQQIASHWHAGCAC